MRIFALLAALSIAACASSQPSPIQYGGGQSAPAQTASPAAPDWVAPEDAPLTQFGLQASDVFRFNPSNPPRSHRVGSDESLLDIATMYQIPMRALVEQNNLDPLAPLQLGRVLRLPPPRVHVVVAGETFAAIAARYNVDARSLALLNRLSLPHEVRAGDRIVLPAIAAGRDVAAAPAPTEEQPVRPQRGTGRFQWPLRGDVIARFGARPGGGRLDGIEIAGRAGARVSAAGDGVVVYAGSDLPGYGGLILIRHSENYVTAYGYNRRLLVGEGDRVSAGAAIAELGGPAEGPPRLLFQVRRGREAIDPAPLLN